MPGGGLPALASLGQPPENRVWQLQPCAELFCRRAGGVCVWGGGGECPDCSGEVAWGTPSSSETMKFREHFEIFRKVGIVLDWKHPCFALTPSVMLYRSWFPSFLAREPPQEGAF